MALSVLGQGKYEECRLSDVCVARFGKGEVAAECKWDRSYIQCHFYNATEGQGL